jgi:hypothetical protein
MRFSIKALVFWTAVLASFLGVLLAATEQNRAWMLLPYSMYMGLLIGWCVYREITQEP